MLLDEQVQIAGLLARRFAVGRMAIDDAVLVPPIAAEEIAQNAALIDRGAIRIVEPVEGGDAGERRRFLDRHPPLRHAEIGLPDAADLAVRPRLMAEPFDDVVKIFLLVAGRAGGIRRRTCRSRGCPYWRRRSRARRTIRSARSRAREIAASPAACCCRSDTATAPAPPGTAPRPPACKAPPRSRRRHERGF